jgi:hypothetical protein
MLARRHEGFTDDVGDVGADNPIHRETCEKQPGAGKKTAADSEKAAEYSDNESQSGQIYRAEVFSRYREVHFALAQW